MKLLSFLLLSSIPLINAAEVTKISPCFTDPSSSTCADYIYPEDLATDDMKSLCDSMPYMPGCSVRDNCPHPGLDPYCHTVSTIADVCVADQKMRNMAGCTNYNALCDAKSVVAQCKVNVYLPDIPTTDLAWKRTQGICTEMIMDGCEKCPIVGKNYPKCDILLVYSQLCMAMPEMKQCGEWAKMCLTVPNSPYCDIAASDNNPPTMKMYFHGGIYDYILFDWWVPRSTTIYALSCVAVFTLGFMLEGIKIGGLHLEHRWIMADTLRHSQKTPYSLNILFTQDIPRVIVTFFSQSLSYLVMLITMTYNYGIFCFTVLGIAVGAGVLRRFLPRPKINMEPVICQEDCC